MGPRQLARSSAELLLPRIVALGLTVVPKASALRQPARSLPVVRLASSETLTLRPRSRRQMHPMVPDGGPFWIPEKPKQLEKDTNTSA